MSGRRGWTRNLILVAGIASHATKRCEAATCMSESVAYDGSASIGYPLGRICRQVGCLDETDRSMRGSFVNCRRAVGNRLADRAIPAPDPALSGTPLCGRMSLGTVISRLRGRSPANRRVDAPEPIAAQRPDASPVRGSGTSRRRRDIRGNGRFAVEVANVEVGRDQGHRVVLLIHVERYADRHEIKTIMSLITILGRARSRSASLSTGLDDQ